MIRRNTWIALGVLAAVVTIALILNQTEGSQTARELTPVPPPLWSVSADEIVGITVEDFVTGAVLEVERNEESLWRMIRPELGPTDAIRVERSASWLSAPSPRAQLSDLDDYSEFGLDVPNYRVQLMMANGTRLEFGAGREVPTGGSRYVSSPGIDGVLIMSTLGLDEVLDLISIADPLKVLTPTAWQAD